MIDTYNVLTIHHQDGVIQFKLRKGGYSIANGLFSFSVEAENMDKSTTAFPACALLSMENIPVIGGKLEALQEYSHSGGMAHNECEDSEIRCYGYFSFHANTVRMQLKIISFQKNELTIEIHAKHDDINYYDTRAKECLATGVFVLKKVHRTQLWIPT